MNERNKTGESGLVLAEETIAAMHRVRVFSDVIDERIHQIDEEGFDAEHDDNHVDGELAKAGATYGYMATQSQRMRFGLKDRVLRGNGLITDYMWPWGLEWWKPGTPRRMLVKAAALIIAEIERIDRRDSPGTCEGCGRPILDGDKCHSCADGPILCEACAPMLSEVIAQYKEILAADEFGPGELDFATPQKLAAMVLEMEADLAANDDRKMVG